MESTTRTTQASGAILLVCLTEVSAIGSTPVLFDPLFDSDGVVVHYRSNDKQPHQEKVKLAIDRIKRRVKSWNVYNNFRWESEHLHSQSIQMQTEIMHQLIKRRWCASVGCVAKHGQHLGNLGIVERPDQGAIAREIKQPVVPVQI